MSFSTQDSGLQNFKKFCLYKESFSCKYCSCLFAFPLNIRVYNHDVWHVVVFIPWKLCWHNREFFTAAVLLYALDTSVFFEYFFRTILHQKIQGWTISWCRFKKRFDNRWPGGISSLNRLKFNLILHDLNTNVHNKTKLFHPRKICQE